MSARATTARNGIRMRRFTVFSRESRWCSRHRTWGVGALPPLRHELGRRRASFPDTAVRCPPCDAQLPAQRAARTENRLPLERPAGPLERRSQEALVLTDRHVGVDAP